MEETPHVIMAGSGAEQFAVSQDSPRKPFNGSVKKGLANVAGRGQILTHY